VQLLHFRLYVGKLLRAQLLCVLVVVVPLKVEHIPIQLRLRAHPLCLLLHRLTTRVRDFGLILIALVVSASRGVVRAPGAHTHPAELVVAPPGLPTTRHMIAALVFLDWSPTCGALFCVCENPRYVLALRAVFEVPISYYGAGGRAVGFFAAGETEDVLTSAGYFFCAQIWVLCRISTTRVRTPSKLLVQKDKFIDADFPIILDCYFVVLYVFINHSLGDLQHSVELRAGHYNFAGEYLVYEIVLPAVDAERVPALQSVLIAFILIAYLTAPLRTLHQLDRT
jgi:hypothetical protein